MDEHVAGAWVLRWKGACLSRRGRCDEPAGQWQAPRVGGQAKWTVRLGCGEVLDPDGGREKPREVATMSKVYVF